MSKTTVINFPVPALPVTVVDDTANGVNLAQSGDTLTVTDAVPSTVTSVVVSGPATVVENATAQYAAKVSGTGNFNSAVVWSAKFGVITSAGLYTAPNTVETDTITATSVQTPAIVGTLPVSVSNAGNTVQFQASGGDDTAAFMTALTATIAGGKILEMNVLGGTFNFNPTSFPAGAKVLIDNGVKIQDQSVYSQFAVMFTIATANVSITSTGTFYVTMPINYANAQKEVADGKDYEYQHAFSFQPGANGCTLSGASISGAAGDGVNFNGGTGLTLSQISSSANIRQGYSVTGAVSNVTMTDCSMSNGPLTGFDFEPDSAGQSVTNFVINGLTSSNNAGGGISFGFFNVGSTAQVSITVEKFTSTGDGETAIGFFNNGGAVGNPTLGEASGSITVNGFNITSCAYDGCYGRKSSAGWTMIFQNGIITNTNVKGEDPHYATEAAIGVSIDGGGIGPPGGVTWTGMTITESNPAVEATDFLAQGTPAGVSVTNSTFNGGALSYP
jgi:hypothetical protein